jgi:hypothetical protein
MGFFLEITVTKRNCISSRAINQARLLGNYWPNEKTQFCERKKPRGTPRKFLLLPGPETFAGKLFIGLNSSTEEFHL